MAVGSSITRVLSAGVCAASFVVIACATAGHASACTADQFVDPFTGQCGGGGGYGGFPSVNGIPCIPGQHLGTCIGIMQNTPRPGATLEP